MTDKEALEKLKKDVLELSDQKQLLVLQVHELTVNKRVQEDRLQKARKEATEIEIENADRIKKCLLKVKQVLEGAEAKESEFVTKLQGLKAWEVQLAEEERKQKDLQVSLDNRITGLAKDREKFEEEYLAKMAKAGEVLNTAEKAADEKYAALSRETTRYTDLVAELDQKQALHAESQARHDDAARQLEIQRNSILDQKQLIQEAIVDIKRRENASDTTLGRLKTLQEDADRRAADLSTRERAVHEKEVAADLRKRELDSREKKVQSLINIHKLEKEIAELS